VISRSGVAVPLVDFLMTRLAAAPLERPLFKRGIPRLVLIEDEGQPFRRFNELRRTEDREEGDWNALVVWRELLAAGYPGCVSLVRDYIRPKRPLRPGRATVRREPQLVQALKVQPEVHARLFSLAFPVAPLRTARDTSVAPHGKLNHATTAESFVRPQRRDPQTLGSRWPCTTPSTTIWSSTISKYSP
jgi:hypothetical protein